MDTNGGARRGPNGPGAECLTSAAAPAKPLTPGLPAQARLPRNPAYTLLPCPRAGLPVRLLREKPRSAARSAVPGRSDCRCGGRPAGFDADRRHQALDRLLGTSDPLSRPNTALDVEPDDQRRRAPARVGLIQSQLGRREMVDDRSHVHRLERLRAEQQVQRRSRQKLIGLCRNGKARSRFGLLRVRSVTSRNGSRRHGRLRG